MENSRTLKWITGGLEVILGFPFIGGTIVISLFWTPLLVMLGIHILGVLMASKEYKTKKGHIVGIVTSCVAWIPFLGMIMHGITALILLLEAGKDK